MVKLPLPARDWLSGYRRADALADLNAALIVTLMMIPQALAYALLAGLPPQTGLYASMLPLVVYALFGSSRTLSVGPMAVVSLMTAAAASQVAAPGSPEYLQAALVLALLSGAFLLLMGLLRMGWVANLLSHAVISGLILASGLLIAASQLKHLLGVSAPGDTLPALIRALLADPGAINSATLALSLLVLCALLALRRLGGPLARLAPLAAVVLSTLAVAGWHLDGVGVAVIGEIPGGLPGLTLPAWDAQLWRQLALPALLIGLVGFVESVSVAQTLAAKRRQRIDPNRELNGLGAANLAAAFSGGFPITGGFARSVVNYDAGARTPMAGVFTAAGLALVALWLTPWLYYLPKATLAATIIIAVLGLLDPGTVVRTWRYSRSDFLALLVTLAGVLLLGITAGLITGVASALALHLWRTSQPHMAELGQMPGTEHFRNVLRHRVVVSPTVLSLRVDESLFFANARQVEDAIYDIAVQRPTVRHVVLLCSAISHIDASALDSLETLNQRLHDAGLTLHLSEVKGPVMDRLTHSSFLDQLGGQVFLSHFEALHTLDPDSACQGLLPAHPEVR
ncbi:SulP family inorganic anion transporter [Alloalcanivorax mobilis]|uniref:SulP family inorganic anion transporter n=1 Tax=Alloalcanivorax mobilis TaxID=2019569 RepID=UPI000C76F3A7